MQRGKWVMEVLLGSPPPPPPPNVPALEETKGTADSGRALSVRERMEQHRSNPQCTSCHRVIDPLGLALENFDATGKWRIRDGGIAVDTKGQLFDGTAIEGPDGLRDALLRHKDVVLLSFTRSLMTYALGRRVEAFDMPAVRRIIRDAEVAELPHQRLREWHRRIGRVPDGEAAGVAASHDKHGRRDGIRRQTVDSCSSPVVICRAAPCSRASAPPSRLPFLDAMLPAGARSRRAASRCA